MFWYNTNDIFCETSSPNGVVIELKALLASHKGAVTHFTFQPLRSVGWHGSVLSYKITPLLADENGCIAVRISPTLMSLITAAMDKDEDLLVIESKSKLFQVDSVPKYRILLRPDSPLSTSPVRSPAGSVLKLQSSGPDHIRVNSISVESEE